MFKKGVVITGFLGLWLCAIAFKKKDSTAPFTLPIPKHVKERLHSPYFPSAQNPLSEEGIALGRQLFYDKNLSRSKNISCGSCHVQAFAFTDSARFSVGHEQQVGDMNSMPLFNMAWNTKFFWDGRAATLQDQIHDPIIDKREMANTWADVVAYVNANPNYTKDFQQIFRTKSVNATQIRMAIEQFVVSILSFNSKYDQYFYKDDFTAFSEQEKRGLKLFLGKAQCNNCHNSVLLTNQQFMNNGLDTAIKIGHYNVTADPIDRGKFKVPTLRNIALTAPYMHDGRFKTLDDVIDFYNSKVQKNSENLDFRMVAFVQPGGLGLTTEEKEDLKAFLLTLTDSTLLTNPKYSDPNVQ